jgi:hypothetical protein
MAMSYAMVGHYFPDKISTIVAVLEVASGFGFMASFNNFSHKTYQSCQTSNFLTSIYIIMYKLKKFDVKIRQLKRNHFLISCVKLSLK